MASWSAKYCRETSMYREILSQDEFASIVMPEKSHLFVPSIPSLLCAAHEWKSAAWFGFPSCYMNSTLYSSMESNDVPRRPWIFFLVNAEFIACRPTTNSNGPVKRRYTRKLREANIGVSGFHLYAEYRGSTRFMVWLTWLTGWIFLILFCLSTGPQANADKLFFTP